MTREEYEARKRRLEGDLRSGMELLEAAFQTQFRALEMVWIPFEFPLCPGSSLALGLGSR